MLPLGVRPERQPVPKSRAVATVLKPKAFGEALLVEVDRSQISAQMPTIEAPERPVLAAELLRPMTLGEK